MGLETVIDLLQCPLCHGDLHLTDDGRTATCERRHSFDVARQGYLHLLPGGSGKNADTAAMIAARDRFLGAGHYRPIADALASAIESRCRPDGVLLDAGAGNGSYLAHVLDQLPGARGLATDVSVPACRRAARAHDRAGAAVADTWSRLPARDGCIHGLLCVFAPRNAEEFARVLAPHGALVVVSPLPGHLAEVRTGLGLLGIEGAKQDRLAASLADRFAPTATAEVHFQLHPDPPALVDLVAMGPNAFHTTTEEIQARVDALPSQQVVTVSVVVSSFEMIT